eukprot:CAMPEP_0201105206 /NCGR_PEP_ID=MMETSP0812-20130820/44083_1 /ASSEMBLY_ACC=CAM_ASM_000668 /TAXON_ID=98059 /ORGANISM="Dinobryon sp., Strain UTEXLB2267" /LENGTH=33 /DNA_ID= /DNA_START= /DNA_END= /DNA_ORIENTATION=
MSDSPMSSASVLDIATTRCLRDFQDGLPNRRPP